MSTSMQILVNVQPVASTHMIVKKDEIDCFIKRNVNFMLSA